MTVTVQGHEMLRNNNKVDLPRKRKSRSDNFYSVQNSMSAWEFFLTYRFDNGYDKN